MTKEISWKDLEDRLREVLHDRESARQLTLAIREDVSADTAERVLLAVTELLARRRKTA